MKLLIILIYLSLIFFEFVEIAFVEIGNYPDYRVQNVNLPECGLRYVPTVHNISVNDKCFRNRYESQVIYDLKGNIRSIRNISTQQRIFRGQNTGFGEGPWTVLLKTKIINRYNVNLCTGTLITFEWVLTAAHCKTWLGQLTILAGSNHREKGEMRIPVKYVSHPYFEEPSKAPHNSGGLVWVKANHDIALIKVNRPFTFQKKDGPHYILNTVCLPDQNKVNEQDENATFFGYGLIETWADFLESTNKYQQKGNVVLSPQKFCRQMFCAKFNDDDNSARPCPGDSGGPLVQYVDSDRLRAVQIGVTRGTVTGDEPSWYDIRTPCRLDAIPEVDWTMVPSFIDWILDTIRENEF